MNEQVEKCLDLMIDNIKGRDFNANILLDEKLNKDDVVRYLSSGLGCEFVWGQSSLNENIVRVCDLKSIFAGRNGDSHALFFGTVPRKIQYLMSSMSCKKSYCVYVYNLQDMKSYTRIQNESPNRTLILDI